MYFSFAKTLVANICVTTFEYDTSLYPSTQRVSLMYHTMNALLLISDFLYQRNTKSHYTTNRRIIKCSFEGLYVFLILNYNIIS